MTTNGKPAAPLADSEVFVDDLLDRIATQIQAGESIDVEALAKAYPERADELRRVLPAMQVLATFEAPRLPGGTEEPSSGIQPLGEMGDFRLIREVGRGGMGIVYEAEQVSLNRRVALKVLPFAATMDSRQLQRFHNEARAAAGLHHTNIVPVYAVGQERGVHYYAMQFIDGQTLAQLIAEQRQRTGQAPLPTDQPTAPHVPGAPAADTAERAATSTERPRLDAAYFRRVAEWGIQAAEALDYAHQMGIVHRDIKPANLLVDTAGRLWVTDFGLAQFQSDTRLTMTGDLVGTLRYMSPEQALAQRVVVDHRTDVYSLGATLYELLTLNPAFTGHDRQELLRKIAFEEPKSPRRINRAIPEELETIVLKAMDKNPAERYATANKRGQNRVRKRLRALRLLHLLRRYAG